MWVRFALTSYLIVSSFLIIFSPANQTASDALFRLGSEQYLDSKVEHLGPTFSSELELGPKTKIVLNLPEKFLHIEDDIAQSILHVHQRLEDLLGVLNIKNLKVELVSEFEFYQERNIPRWVNAMYAGDAVTIPVSSDLSSKDLFASIQHEYTHAAIKSVSNGKCPVWLDEGLAQIIEIEHHPEMHYDLLMTFNRYQPLRLAGLEGSFASISTELLPVAYAQSFFTARELLENYSKEDLAKYFAMLRAGVSSSTALERAFGVKESQLSRKVRRKVLFDA